MSKTVSSHFCSLMYPCGRVRLLRLRLRPRLGARVRRGATRVRRLASLDVKPASRGHRVAWVHRVVWVQLGWVQRVVWVHAWCAVLARS